MVRLLHFSDLHLGAASYGRFDPETGLSSRMGDFLAALDQVVDYALTQDVHLVLFAGDAYKTCDPSPTHQREFARRVGRLARAGVPIVLLTGNHDVPNARGRASALSIFETLEVENVRVADKPTTLHVNTRGGPIQIVALPWLGLSLLAAMEEYKNLTISELRDTIVDVAESFVLEQIAGLDPSTPAVLLAHALAFGAASGSERYTVLGQDLLLPYGLYAHPRFDYVALGHVHKHQVLNDSPPAVYAGSLERVDFGEEDEEKGFVVAEVERGHTDFRFVPMSARRFVTIRVEAMGDDPMAAIAQAVARHPVDGAVVRMFVRTKAELEPQIDDRICRQLLKDAFHIAAIVHDVDRSERVRLVSDKSVETLTPRELLVEYLKYKEVPSDRVQTLLEHADRLMTADPG